MAYSTSLQLNINRLETLVEVVDSFTRCLSHEIHVTMPGLHLQADEAQQERSVDCVAPQPSDTVYTGWRIGGKGQ